MNWIFDLFLFICFIYFYLSLEWDIWFIFVYQFYLFLFIIWTGYLIYFYLSIKLDILFLFINFNHQVMTVMFLEKKILTIPQRFMLIHFEKRVGQGHLCRKRQKKQSIEQCSCFWFLCFEINSPPPPPNHHVFFFSCSLFLLFTHINTHTCTYSFLSLFDSYTLIYNIDDNILIYF